MKTFRRYFKLVFIYLLLSSGIWMFLNCCSNSYNHLSEEKITPAGIILKGDSAKITVLNSDCSLTTKIFNPESKLYYYAYIFAPDEAKILSAAADKLVN